MNDDKVSMDFRQVNVKNAQVGLQNTISWKKKIGRHDVRMEESMCWKWVISSKAKDTYQNKVCKQSHCVQRWFEFKKTSVYVMLNKKWWCCINKFLRPKFWVVANAIISYLNLIMITCMMNQSRGHWLLSNALTTIVNISFSMEVEVMGLGDRFEIIDEFDLELFFIQKTYGRRLLRWTNRSLIYYNIWSIKCFQHTW